MSGSGAQVVVVVVRAQGQGPGQGPGQARPGPVVALAFIGQTGSGQARPDQPGQARPGAGQGPPRRQTSSPRPSVPSGLVRRPDRPARQAPWTRVRSDAHVRPCPGQAPRQAPDPSDSGLSGQAQVRPGARPGTGQVVRPPARSCPGWLVSPRRQPQGRARPGQAIRPDRPGPAPYQPTTTASYKLQYCQFFQSNLGVVRPGSGLPRPGPGQVRRQGRVRPGQARLCQARPGPSGSVRASRQGRPDAQVVRPVVVPVRTARPDRHRRRQVRARPSDSPGRAQGRASPDSRRRVVVVGSGRRQAQVRRPPVRRQAPSPVTGRRANRPARQTRPAPARVRPDRPRPGGQVRSVRSSQVVVDWPGPASALPRGQGAARSGSDSQSPNALPS